MIHHSLTTLLCGVAVLSLSATLAVGQGRTTVGGLPAGDQVSGASTELRGLVVSDGESTLPRTPWGNPDLQGIWNNSTTTPFERLTAAEQERGRLAQEPGRRATGGTGAAWIERAEGLERESLIVDPPDGRMPALTPAARMTRETRAARRRDQPADSWRDRGLWERWLTRGVPRVPNNYNSNMLILQTPTTVVILNEMINETRVVYLDDRPHISMNIRL